MAEVLASLKKIGGSEQYTETVLWTNPSPTADFAAQTITLSDSISNYKYIGIKYCFNKTNTSIIDTAIYKTEEVRASIIDSGTDGNVILLGLETANKYTFGRLVGYVSDTSIKFTLGYRLSAASSSANACIPLEILGINELAHGKIAPNETIFLGNFASTSMSLTTFTLLDDLSNYRYLIMANSQKDANGNMISDRSAVDAILSIEQLKNDGSITYHSALSNGSAFNVTIGYVDDTHITEQRTGSTNKGFWIYAV